MEIATTHKRRELFLALAEARLERGARQFEIAVLAGLDPAELSRILNWRLDPTPVQAQRIAAALGRVTEELFPDVRAPGGASARTASCETGGLES
jgi:transcriptional regulator with XRE-family HTH domain